MKKQKMYGIGTKKYMNHGAFCAVVWYNKMSECRMRKIVIELTNSGIWIIINRMHMRFGVLCCSDMRRLRTV